MIGLNVNRLTSPSQHQSRSQTVISSKPLLRFTVDQLKTFWVDILSVFNDKLLVSYYGLSQLLIYNYTGHHLYTISHQLLYVVCDATWTPKGNIVLTELKGMVVLMSQVGKIISVRGDFFPLRLSVSNDNIIYLADLAHGVLESRDDGVTWNKVSISYFGCTFRQVIKVAIGSIDYFWILGEFIGDKRPFMRLYSLDNRNFNSYAPLKHYNFASENKKYINFQSSSLSYSDNTTIIVSEVDKKVVYMLFVNGTYYSVLLPSDRIKNKPFRLAVDNKRQLLYVGQEAGVVEVFNLK